MSNWLTRCLPCHKTTFEVIDKADKKSEKDKLIAIPPGPDRFQLYAVPALASIGTALLTLPGYANLTPVIVETYNLTSSSSALPTPLWMGLTFGGGAVGLVCVGSAIVISCCFPNKPTQYIDTAGDASFGTNPAYQALGDDDAIDLSKTK